MPRESMRSRAFDAKDKKGGAASHKKSGKYEQIRMDAVAKVILLGNTGTGKSCLLQRYLKDTFCAHKQMTIGVAHGNRTEVVNDKDVKLFIWDTAGDERYRSLTRLYYRDAKAAVICYDLTERSSFDAITYWIQELSDKEDCMIFLVGTKRDILLDSSPCSELYDAMDSYTRLPRAVHPAEVEHLMSRYKNADIRAVYETSSRSGDNVDTLFQDVAKHFCDKYSESIFRDTSTTGAGSIHLGRHTKRKRKCCLSQ